MQQLTFHIIYMPGTVRYLTPLLSSLLKWSTADFRLVSNGCNAEERELLSKLCAGCPRLSYVELPSQSPVAHGAALQQLQAINQEPQFCFMDSDIFATGPFLPSVSEAISRYKALFSCTPLWCKPGESILPPDHSEIQGRHSHTEDGICLGSTYFAIYDSDVLASIMKNEDVNFDVVRWEQIRSDHQKVLQEMRLNRQEYDTGKLINLLLHLRGHSSRFLDIPQLHHLGGFSRYSTDGRKAFSERLTASARMSGQFKIRRLISSLHSWIPFQRFRPLRRKLAQSKAIRYMSVMKYFSELMIAAVDGADPPTLLPIVDASMEERVASTAGALMELYERRAS